MFSGGGGEVSYYLVAYFVTEAATRGVLLKKVFLKFLQNSQENPSSRRSFLIKLQLKKRLWYG